MNKTTYIVGGIALAVGVGIGYFIGKTRAERLAEEYINEELTKFFDREDREITITEHDPSPGVKRDIIQEIADREHELETYLAAYKDDMPSNETIVGTEEIHQEVDPDDPASYEEHGAMITIVDETGDEVTTYHRTDLDMFDEEYDDEDPDDDSQDGVYLSRESWRVGIISPEDWRAGMPGHVREDLTYYEVDDILVDSSDVIVTDDEIIGDGLSNFGVFGAPPDQVFVRNNEKHFDFRITRVNDSYHESVLGIDMDDEDTSPRKMRAMYE